MGILLLRALQICPSTNLIGTLSVVTHERGDYGHEQTTRRRVVGHFRHHSDQNEDDQKHEPARQIIEDEMFPNPRGQTRNLQQSDNILLLLLQALSVSSDCCRNGYRN